MAVNLQMGKMMMNVGVMEVVAWCCCLIAIMFEAQLCLCELTSTSSASVAPRATIDNQSTLNSLKIEKIRFTSNGATTESYLRFMLNLLNVLTEDADRSGSIPILPQLSETKSNSYVHVEISNGRSQTLTFAIYITNVYVVGYQNNANSIAYFFNSYKDSKLQTAAFPNAARRELLHFDGNYDSLGDRGTVPLGFDELTNAISTLYKYPSGSDDRQMRRAFLVVIQMISEAARFKNLRQLILNTIPNGRPYTPDGLMQEYETSWGQISCAVQNANPNGNFQTPITLTYGSQQVVLRTVSDVIPIVGILLRNCGSSLETQTDVLFSTSNQPSLKSIVVAAYIG